MVRWGDKIHSSVSSFFLFFFSFFFFFLVLLGLVSGVGLDDPFTIIIIIIIIILFVSFHTCTNWWPSLEQRVSSALWDTLYWSDRTLYTDHIGAVVRMVSILQRISNFLSLFQIIWGYSKGSSVTVIFHNSLSFSASSRYLSIFSLLITLTH